VGDSGLGEEPGGAGGSAWAEVEETAGSSPRSKGERGSE